MGARSKKLYMISSWLVPIMPLVIALIGWCNNLNGTEVWLVNRPNVWQIVQRMQEVSFELYIFSWLMFFGAVFYKRQGDPWLVEKLQFILDRYQDGAFHIDSEQIAAPKDHNRVTLFRYQKGWFVRHWSAKYWYWPWGKHSPFTSFLVPVLRSGHISKKTSIAFAVSDDSDKTEGVAGQAWACETALAVGGLPLMEVTTGVRAKTLYAGRTSSDREMIETYIKRNRHMPCSIVAIPVEKAGKLWGVLVLDSRNPEGVTEAAVENYRLTVALIGHLLERAS